MNRRKGPPLLGRVGTTDAACDVGGSAEIIVMSKLHERFPTAESLLSLTPDVLAPILLQIVAADRQRGMFWPPNITQVTIGSGMTAEGQHAYPHHKQGQVDGLVGETFELLRRMGLIHPAPDTNG